MDDFGPSKKDFERKGMEGMRTIKDAIEENKKREEELYGTHDEEKVYRKSICQESDRYCVALNRRAKTS